MKVIFSIVSYEYAEKVKKLFKAAGSDFMLSANGKGTADSQFSEFVGLGENKKTVIIGIIPKLGVKGLYKELEKGIHITKAGAGIAFTVPVSRISAAITAFYPQTETKTKVKEEKMETEFELIIVIVNRGSFETVKQAARAEGARGGTLLHGLGIGGAEAEKFLGISMQPEKDIVLIVVPKSDARQLMKHIAETAGLKSENKGVCFSLPVESALGLASADDV